VKGRVLTYSLPRPFFGLNIPIPVQSSFMRGYLVDAGYLFKLPLVEMVFSDSYYMLLMALRESHEEKIDICMTSIMILPLDKPELLSIIVNLGKSKKWHFPLEGLVLSAAQIIDWADNFIFYRKIKST